MRKTAVVVGVLFWISNLATVIGSVILGPIPGAANALTSLYPHGTQVVVGTLIAQINDAAIIGYAALLFPVLRTTSEGLALGYVAFKLVEAVMLVVGAVALLSLIALSQDYLAAKAAEASVKAVAEVTLSQQFWAGRLAALAYLVATPILNFLLYRARLVPRFIPVWGFIALLMLATGLAIGVGDPTRGFQLGQLLVIPIILWELVFATWLILRGFSLSPVATGDSRRVL